MKSKGKDNVPAGRRSLLHSHSICVSGRMRQAGY